MDITEKEFMAYEEIRASGITNMWDTSTVSKLSNLDEDTILYIIGNYDELHEKYLED